MYILLFPILDRPASRIPQEQWAACSARRPSEVNCPSLVRDGHVFCNFACFFSVGVLSGGNPLSTLGEHANSTQKGPGDSPPEVWGGPAPPPETTAPQGANRNKNRQGDGRGR